MFKKGRKKTGGRKKGGVKSQEQKLVDLLVKESVKEREGLVKALIDKGKKGDDKSLKVIFERVLGRVKEEKVIDKEENLIVINIIPPKGEPKQDERSEKEE